MSHQDKTLTSADTRALWHAIDDMAYAHRSMRCLKDLGQEVIDGHAKKLKQARAALRKVNELRKQGL